MGQQDERELVPLKSDFDVVVRGYRRSQVQFYIRQTEHEVRMLTEDRDSALGQVTDLSAQLDAARGEIESLRQQLDDVARTPIDESALSARMRRMVRLAQDEADEIITQAQATAEHEWARSEQAASELRGRYERLVAEADEWRRQADEQRNEALEQTRQDIERMAREAEQQRRKLDTQAEERRTKVEEDFEISMAARRDEENRVMAERDHNSRKEAERRIREATEEAERRIKLADEHAEMMRRLRQATAERVRAAQEMLVDAEPFLSASELATDCQVAEAYVQASIRSGHSRPWEATMPAAGDGTVSPLSGVHVGHEDEPEQSAAAEDAGQATTEAAPDSEVVVPQQREKAREASSELVEQS